MPYDVFISYSHQADASLDRKSTRLNSSHLVISYAVFCLKKKKHSMPASLHPSMPRRPPPTLYSPTRTSCTRADGSVVSVWSLRHASCRRADSDSLVPCCL